MSVLYIFLMLGAILLMLNAIVIFFRNIKTIVNYMSEDFGGKYLFAGYFALLLFFLIAYIAYAVIMFLGKIAVSNLLVLLLLFFGAGFVLITMEFNKKLFTTIFYERRNQIDPLTGLLNKGATRITIEDYLVKKKDCVLAVADLDGFKTLNDTLGHMEGDKILIEVSNILAKFTKDGDVLGRFGGDEFVILFTDKSLQEVTVLADAIVNEVRTYFMKNRPEFQTGISIGVSFWQREISYEELFRRADTALYRAKEKGKNRTVVWTES